MDFSTLYFRYRPSIFDLSVLSSIISIAKAWEPIESIANGSIPIRISRGKMADVSIAELRKVRSVKDSHQTLLLNMLMSGTKPFDAILCLSVCRLGAESKLDQIFIFTETNELDRDAVSPALALVTACLMILVTRGSFPASNASSAKNPLPKFIISMIEGLTDEGSLKDASMSFDAKNISMIGLFSEDSLSGWPAVVANRMNLGVAGHKTLKLALSIGESYKKDDERDSKMFKVLLDKASLMNGGFYSALHPANNSAQNKFPRFYLNTLVLCYRVAPGNHEAKVKMIRNMGGFDSEQRLDKESFMKNSVMDYINWDLNEIAYWIGDAVKFGVYAEISSEEKDAFQNPLDNIQITNANITSSSSMRQLSTKQKSVEKETLPLFSSAKPPTQYSTTTSGASSSTQPSLSFGELKTEAKKDKKSEKK